MKIKLIVSLFIVININKVLCSGFSSLFNRSINSIKKNINIENICGIDSFKKFFKNCENYLKVIKFYKEKEFILLEILPIINNYQNDLNKIFYLLQNKLKNNDPEYLYFLDSKLSELNIQLEYLKNNDSNECFENLILHMRKKYTREFYALLKQKNIYCVKDLEVYGDIFFDVIVKSIFIEFLLKGSVNPIEYLCVFFEMIYSNNKAVSNFLQLNKRHYFNYRLILLIILLKIFYDLGSVKEDIVRYENHHCDILNDIVFEDNEFSINMHDLNFNMSNFAFQILKIFEEYRDYFINEVENGSDYRLLLKIKLNSTIFYLATHSSINFKFSIISNLNRSNFLLKFYINNCKNNHCIEMIKNNYSCRGDNFIEYKKLYSSDLFFNKNSILSNRNESCFINFGNGICINIDWNMNNIEYYIIHILLDMHSKKLKVIEKLNEDYIKSIIEFIG